jgi:hypothetical protein
VIVDIKPVKPGATNINKPGVTEKFKPAEPPSVSRPDSPPPVISNLSAEFSRADLNDPAKVDQMVPRALDEVLQQDFRDAGLNLPEERKMVLDWMSEDPTFRSLALTYLRDVLT